MLAIANVSRFIMAGNPAFVCSLQLILHLVSDHRHPRLLRACREQPRRRTGEQRDEVRRYRAQRHAEWPEAWRPARRPVQGSVQGALGVARSLDISRFGSFVKPTVNWFEQRACLIRPFLRPPEFCKACGGA
jgi:hypothetical protein